jgi:biopolymer transport protein TolQ
LAALFKELTARSGQLAGLESVFEAGFREFARLRNRRQMDARVMLEGAQRAMRVTVAREVDRLEQSLEFLATVGSTSPYVGLFGTVWGIMVAFHGLASVKEATIAMVAPGISEALIATAMGLFAAIPAVIAYNRYSNKVDRLNSRYDTFQEEFSQILQRQSHVEDNG